jgi:hypothetical protein
MRIIGMDIHRSCAQVAILEKGQITKELRVDLTCDPLIMFAKTNRKQCCRRGRSFICYDQHGCGLTDWDAHSVCFEDWIKDLETVVRSRRC